MNDAAYFLTVENDHNGRYVSWSHRIDNDPSAADLERAKASFAEWDMEHKGE